jgi:hypothetical protein
VDVHIGYVDIRDSNGGGVDRGNLEGIIDGGADRGADVGSICAFNGEVDVLNRGLRQLHGVGGELDAFDSVVDDGKLSADGQLYCVGGKLGNGRDLDFVDETVNDREGQEVGAFVGKLEVAGRELRQGMKIELQALESLIGNRKMRTPDREGFDRKLGVGGLLGNCGNTSWDVIRDSRRELMIWFDWSSRKTGRQQA